MAVLLALLPAAGHDQLWLLYAARLVLHGAPLYGPQVFETNPPLIIWLSMIPESLAQITHIPDTALGKLGVVVVEAGVGALCLQLLRAQRTKLSSATLAALVFAFVTTFAVMPARDFGQRDHFLILFLFPYVFAAAVRAEGLPLARGLGWLVGLLALLGCALKPFQLLVPLCIESAILLGNPKGFLRQLLRPEILAMAASGAAFLAAIQLFAPLYFTSVVPLVRATYWAYSTQPFAGILAASIQLQVLLLTVAALLLSTGWRDARAITRMLFIAGAAATLAYYVQGTGWYYQQLPALSFLSFALAFQLLDLAIRRSWRLPRWSVPAAAALMLLALALTTHFMNYPFTPERSFPLDQPDPSLFAGIPPGTAVMTLSPSVDDTIMPLFKFDLTLGERYPAFLLLPALLRAEDPQGKAVPHHFAAGELAELDRVQHAYMVEDLTRWQPALLLVERCQDPAVQCQVLEERHDNLLAFFLRDPAFAAIFSHYRYRRSAGAYDAYVRAGN